MANLFLDYLGGNNANDATSFANRVKDITNGITAARVAPGDVVRIMKSPDPTLVDSAGIWTDCPASAYTSTVPVVSGASITGLSNATPIVATTGSAHGLTSGQIIRLINATGNTAANGVWEVNVLTTTTFELKGSAGNGAYGSNASYTIIDNLVVRIPAVLLKNIDNGQTAWTGANSATTAVDTTNFHEYTGSAQITLPGSPATATLYAYRALPGGAADFSGYQQVTFWIRVSASTVANNLNLCLCSDAAGATPVNTIAIPAITGANQWVPIVVNTAGALGASIQSVALYSGSSAPSASLVVRLDNIMACLASSDAKSINLTSLIGKKSALRHAIVSSTNATPIVMTVTGHSYTNGQYVKIQDHTTNTNANDVWKVANVTTDTFELVDRVTGENSVGNGTGGATGTVVSDEGWWTIDNITVNSTTTIIMLGFCNATIQGYNTRGYSGVSETIATYKRETIKWDMPATSTTDLNTIQDGGTETSLIAYSGGWDTTNMTAQEGDTFWDAQNCFGRFIRSTNSSFGWMSFDRLHFVRASIAMFCTVNGHHVDYMQNISVETCLVNSLLSNHGMLLSNGSGGQPYTLDNITGGRIKMVGMRSSRNANAAFGMRGGADLVVDVLNILNTSGYAFGSYNGDGPVQEVYVRSGRFEKNAAGSIQAPTYFLTSAFSRVVMDSVEATFSASAERFTWLYSHNHDNVVGTHRFWSYGVTVDSESSVRHTASGLAWRVSVTNSLRTATNPVRHRLCSVPCNSGQVVTVKAWVRRNNTGTFIGIQCPGKQLSGVPADVSAIISAAVDTWEELSLTFTPTEAGVVDIYWYAYGGTSNASYIDDVTITVGGSAIDLTTMDFARWGLPFVQYKPAGGTGIVAGNVRGGFIN